ncbi:hypothetical protein [Neptunicella sp. SCSIO 80796]|uniref:hypothetical protein n=1 Tax=Neptunicella plasticusilytica TaxID=3117012 RepID=UPI003A4D8F1B
MSKLDKDQVIEKFTQAYKAANGKAPVIEAKGGWYSVDGEKNVRLAQLDEQADELAASKKAPAAKAEKATPAKKAEAAPKAKKAAVSKKAESTPKPAKKSAAKKTKKSAGFSVKEFWNNLLKSKDHDCDTPR